MKIPLSVNSFAILDDIATMNGVKAIDWAIASGVKYASRISDWRKIRDLEAQGEDSSSIPRAFTMETLEMLLSGLDKILGREFVRKELRKRLSMAKSLDEQNLILMLTAPSTRKADINLYLKTIHESAEKKEE